MYKQTKYKVLRVVLENGESVWKEEIVSGIKIGPLGISAVVDEQGVELAVDNISVIARESTNMFDKDGNEIYFGDIVKVPISKAKLDYIEGKEYSKEHFTEGEVMTEDVLLPIVWINGAYCLVIEGFDTPIYLTQENTRQMEKIGNVYQHGKLLEKEIDEKKVFGEKKEVEINNN